MRVGLMAVAKKLWVKTMIKIQNALDWIIPILQHKQVPFHITGGFAAHLYGATRPINDIDIDMPTACLDSVTPEVREFMDVAPQRHKDTTWDLYVATLNYQGQLIDLTGNTDAYVCNKTSGAWDSLEMNFNEINWIEAYGHQLPVQNTRDLISYKLKIAYDEAKHAGDVEAIRRSIHYKTAEGRFAPSW
jgi:hypothetical protein